jgi:translation initiation factor 2 beta subunit (eIF-2beta)/eIF-5
MHAPHSYTHSFSPPLILTHIACPRTDPTKYFGFELGAQSKFDKETERAVVNGSHQAGDLAKMLEKFIEIFILCPTCKCVV